MDTKTIMHIIDHTMLNGYSTEGDIKRLIEEANEFGAYAVCIEPNFMRLARQYIDSNSYEIKLSVVLDFPFGASATEARVALAKIYANYADEIDAVAPIGLVKSGSWDIVKDDIRAVVEAAHESNAKIKIIAEDAYTTREEKRALYKIICDADADFIKTGTGFENRDYAASIGNKTGAQAENVALMAEVASAAAPNIGIKAAGGIRSVGQIEELLKAAKRNPDPSSFRIGASGTGKIYEECRSIFG